MLGKTAVDEKFVFNNFKQVFDLNDKSVIEVGGALPEDLFKCTNIKEWISIDPRNDDENVSEICKRIKGIGSNIPFEDNYFDYMFSSNAFEHIQNLDHTLSEAMRVIKPGGYLYSHFGPIWSAPDGHHIDIRVDDIEFYFWNKSEIPHWAHLVFNENELCNLFEKKFSKNVAEKIVAAIYKSDWINRLNYEDYLDLFFKSGFNILHLETCNEIDYPYKYPKDLISDKEIFERLISMKLFNKNIMCRDILIIMQKPDTKIKRI